LEETGLFQRGKKGARGGTLRNIVNSSGEVSPKFQGLRKKVLTLAIQFAAGHFRDVPGLVSVVCYSLSQFLSTFAADFRLRHSGTPQRL
jgi:hypothetical protein